MPSGKVHLRIEIGLLAAGAAASAPLWCAGALPWPETVAFIGSYLFSSLFLSPDLDLYSSRPSRRWGIARVLWLPYSGLFRHRRLSHHVLVGPLTRILYLGAVALLAVLATGLLTKEPLRLSAPTLPLLVAVLSGLYLPNQIHTLVDRLSSLWGRRARR